MQVESQANMNDRITRGLRSQYSVERTALIVEKANEEYAYRNPSANVPELYELFEGNYIDSALEQLGFGSWCIGRPKSLLSPAKPSGKTSFRPTPISKRQTLRQQTVSEEHPNHSRSLADILDSMIPNPLPESIGPSDNAIHHLNILLFARPNGGKTNLGESILQSVIGRYGSENVRALRSSRDLPAIFEHLNECFEVGIPKAIVLFFDDLTKALDKLTGTLTIRGGSYGTNDFLDGSLRSFSGTISEKENRKAFWLDRWYDIRGELFKRGMHEGLVVMIGAVHRFYATPLDMRSDCDLLLVRSTGTPGTFDAKTVARMLGHVAYSAMRQHETDALRNRSELAWTGFATKSDTGVMRIPRAEATLMRTVFSKTVSHRSRRPWWGFLLPIAGTAIALALLLSPWW